MIDAKALPEFKKHIETLASQLSLFENKVKDAAEIEPGDKGPEEERERILSIIVSYQKKLPDLEKQASGPLFKNGSDPIDVSKALKSLKELDKTFINLKQDVEQISEDLDKVKRNIAVLSSNNASMKKNVNKFPFLKEVTEHLSQVLYDLSMQMYILFEGLDGRSIANMTNILSTYNEFRDCASLWAAFSHYNSKTSLKNLSVNEKIMIELTKEPRCKARLKELFK
jgi:chromosome segregation ATPase